MEDEFICVDDLSQHLASLPSPGAFYGVFDGHNGKDAASFTKRNILEFIIQEFFRSSEGDAAKRALKNAFIRADHALFDAKNLDHSSGTTALTALIFGR